MATGVFNAAPLRRYSGGMATSLQLPAGVSAEDIKALASRFGASNLRVFGSRATGRARPDSDLDLLVELEPGRDLFDLIELKHALEERTGAAVDVVTERGLSPYMRDGILQSARSL
ncbi:nucleotidyltransferase family protein [Azospirillum brasilense]|uniref:nucleotidyltransferase family protein n=1 Tax=Azospirillum brasilense TaxID=192 RepID=UPI001FFF3826|nr:nucleotidyltransferase family protein [Azospirillum brasilense]